MTAGDSVCVRACARTRVLYVYVCVCTQATYVSVSTCLRLCVYVHTCVLYVSAREHVFKVVLVWCMYVYVCIRVYVRLSVSP